MVDSFLLINPTDFLLINAGGDKLVISSDTVEVTINLILDGISIVTGTRSEI